jgi:hypothetical protein
VHASVRACVHANATSTELHAQKIGGRDRGDEEMFVEPKRGMDWLERERERERERGLDGHVLPLSRIPISISFPATRPGALSFVLSFLHSRATLMGKPISLRFYSTFLYLTEINTQDTTLTNTVFDLALRMEARKGCSGTHDRRSLYQLLPTAWHYIGSCAMFKKQTPPRRAACACGPRFS